MTLFPTFGLLVFLIGALAYPHGAPEEACGSMDPRKGHGKSKAKGPPNYAVNFSSTSYKPNQKIQVTLLGTENEYFKGYLLEGRAVKVNNATEPVGYFANTTTSHILCASSKNGNGITHNKNTVRQTETFEWTAPSESVGDIVFYYTVVRGEAPKKHSHPSDYYKGLKSSPLSPQSFDSPFIKKMTMQ